MPEARLVAHAGERQGSLLPESSPASAKGSLPRPTVSGKFLCVGDEKLYVRGATYGTFQPDRNGVMYPSPDTVARDFDEMSANGLNSVRTYTVPPQWMLDLAHDAGLHVMVGIPWEQHVNFLESRSRARSIEDRVKAAVASCAGHPAVLCYAVGNEIPSPIARWLGRRPVERFIRRLYRAAKSEDPGGLVTYVNYPPTEYLQLDFLDLACFNVYLERRTALAAYLARLQNLTGELPLLLAEVGLDSRGHGEPKQAAMLDWQIRSAFEAGCAGGFVFAWTDEWYVSYLSSEGTAAGGLDIDDWEFGLTRRDRTAKPALREVREAFEQAPFGRHREWPRISVVVCTHNGAKTLPFCLRGLSELEYPDFEVIVVDDGSTDASAEIAKAFGVTVISTENHGLASARNLGLRFATGEIVAYLDDDASPDAHWLHYLTLGFQDGGYAAVGGPNLPPPDAGALGGCVADAPGGPTHVLVSDREAEHIPGCNMAFRKKALEDLGGFDPRFRVAGDDVDICWRLSAAGELLGFSPAAFVWHRPRDSIRAYWRQQRGYGRAEALLERKWPEKYDAGRGARWSGRLYGRSPRMGLGPSRVYYGTWGTELFQSLYQRGDRTSLDALIGPGWYVLIATLALLVAGASVWRPMLVAAPLLIVAVAVPVIAAAAAAARTPTIARGLLPARQLARRFLVTTLLHILQPLARLAGRIRGVTPASPSERRFAAPLRRVVKTWSETWQSNVQRLAEIEAGLRGSGAIVSPGGAYDRWDLQARHGLTGWVRIRMGVEEHGAGRQMVLVQVAPRYSRIALALAVLLVLLAIAAGVDHHMLAMLLFGAVGLMIAGSAVRSASRAMATALHLIDDSTEAEAEMVVSGVLVEQRQAARPT
jgi:GT2 family glycosyltransferase